MSFATEVQTPQLTIIRIGETTIQGTPITSTEGYVTVRNSIGKGAIASVLNPTQAGNGEQIVTIINYDRPEREETDIVTITESPVVGNRRGEKEVLVSITSMKEGQVRQEQEKILLRRSVDLKRIDPTANPHVPLGSEALLAQSALSRNAIRFNLALRAIGLRSTDGKQQEELIAKLKEMGVSESILDVMRKGSASGSV
jgi:hypothetical protein